MKYNALIFDFDGTIVDTLTEAAEIYNVLAEDYGYKKVKIDEIPSMRHYNMKKLIKELGISKLRIPFLLAKGRRLLKKRIDQLSPIVDMVETMKELRKDAVNFGILTSNSTENVELFLDRYGIKDLFTFISSTSKLSGKSKHINSISRTFSIDKADMLYIGDEIRDVKASQKAGIAVAAVTWGFNSKDSLSLENPTYLIDTPKQLLEIAR